MTIQPEDPSATPMRRVDLGGGQISASIDPRYDPKIQKRIRGQALAIVGVSFIVLAIAFAVPFIVHIFGLSLS
jgi:hypothetical protein